MVFLSLGGVGFSPILPGTLGSLISTILFFFCFPLLPHSFFLRIVFLLSIFGILFFVSIPLITAEKKDGQVDHHFIVVDELLGMLTTIFPIVIFRMPLLWEIGVTFVFFRFFDIVKPLGIRTIDQKNTPISVLLDDVFAGIYAAICLIGTTLLVASLSQT